MSALSDDVLAQLSETTGLSQQQLLDLLALSPDDQAQAVADWKSLGKMTWTQKPGALDAVVTGLEFVGTIAGVVGGVAGAASAVAALRSL